MTYGAYASGGYAPSRRGGAGRFTQPILCATALVLGAGVGLCMLYGPTPEPAVGTKPPLAIPTHPATPTNLPASAHPRVIMHYTGLLDPTPAMGAAAFAEGPRLATQVEPVSHLIEVQSADVAEAEVPRPAARVAEAEVPLPPQRDAAFPALQADVPLPPERLAEVELPVIAPPPVVSALEEVPLPAPRPRELAREIAPAPAAHRLASATPRPAPAPSFFDRMFGRQPPPALAYAATEERGIERVGAAAAYGGQTAIYDITAHTVYMPDGTRLEAHSGLGEAFDNPASVTEHMRGATPPNVYALTPREAVFHGVRALRLTPLAGTTFGREGLLAHTYMLRGHSGESNGCVVFRNYAAFLAAYERGEITKLAVVARM